jgi:hypothetical protein
MPAREERVSQRFRKEVSKLVSHLRLPSGQIRVLKRCELAAIERSLEDLALNLEAWESQIASGLPQLGMPTLETYPGISCQPGPEELNPPGPCYQEQPAAPAEPHPFLHAPPAPPLRVRPRMADLNRPALPCFGENGRVVGSG